MREGRFSATAFGEFALFSQQSTKISGKPPGTFGKARSDLEILHSGSLLVPGHPCVTLGSPVLSRPPRRCGRSSYEDPAFFYGLDSSCATGCS